jgi:DNA-binding NarL/FixJ family response regulator
MIRPSEQKSEPTLFIADSNLLLCETLTETLRSRHFTVKSFAIDGKDAASQIRRYRPTVSIISSDLPLIDGLELARSAQKNELDTEVILITTNHDAVRQMAMAQIETSGHLHRGFGISELYFCIQEIFSGRAYVSPILRTVLNELQDEGIQEYTPVVNLLKCLTIREKEVLKAIAKSYTTPKIADMFYISASTVNNHRANIMEKLNIKGRNQLISIALTLKPFLEQAA